MPQDGRINKADQGTRNDLRVATYPTLTGEKIVLRLFANSAVLTLQELGLPLAARTQLENFLRRHAGLLLLTGPAGSGKTTTIYSCLRFLAQLGGRHIITVEDPVEQVIPGIMQTEVHEARGLTFATAARHLLRQDPQVLVIGEIRDEETAQIAVRAALTDHLVIATLHAGSCRSVFERLLAFCGDTYAVASALELILNQRLLRRVCQKCGGPGCKDCLQTGYRGRIPALEYLLVDESLRRQVREGGPSAVAAEPSLQQGAWALVQSGITKMEEYERFFGS
jgi:type II secretory ATPase GspE/PulE/Tfp pilus assembly ATPase PilB-like protein